MIGREKRLGKEPATAMEDKFPVGMRVLAIDNDPVFLSVVDYLLRTCKFNPTTVEDGSTALRILREGGKDQFDLVITDVHMPDMDGFKLVELIVLEMDLPVIVLSVNGDMETVMKGITHGACDWLVKPVPIEQVMNIWQHVIRKKLGVLNHNNSASDGVDQRVQPVIVEGDKGGKTIKCSSKTKNDGDDSDENKGRSSVATRTKQRLSWTNELHGRFLEAVNRLGVDNAVPKRILEMMNVNCVTRESVASHLQKYRLYRKRFTNDPRKSNPLSDSFDKRNSCYYMNMNHQGNSSNYHKHQTGWPSSIVGFRGSKNPYVAPSLLGAQGASTQSMNWKIGTVDHGRGMLRHDVPWLPDTRRCHTLNPPVRSFAKISDHTMMDAFPPIHSRKAYTSVLREKLLEASNLGPSSNLGNSSFAKIPNGAEPINQFPVQLPESISQLSSQMNRSSSMAVPRHDAKVPYLVESSSNPWHKYLAPSSFLDHMDGTALAQSDVNVPQINQLHSFGSSPSQIPMIQNEHQNQMEGIVNNNNDNTAAGVFSVPMTPLFDMANNTSPIQMSDNFSPMTQMVNGGSTSSPLANLQTGSSVAPPTQMVSGGTISPAFPDLQDSSIAPMQDASDILPVQEGPIDQQDIGDQPNYNDPFFLDDILTSMFNQDFSEVGAFLGEEW